MAKKSSKIKKIQFGKKVSPVKLIIMAVVVIGLVASVGLVKKNQENRSQARYVEEKTTKVCTPLSISCDGNTSKICNKNGTAKTTLKICSNNQICKNLLGCVAKSSTTNSKTRVWYCSGGTTCKYSVSTFVDEKDWYAKGNVSKPFFNNNTEDYCKAHCGRR